MPSRINWQDHAEGYVQHEYLQNRRMERIASPVVSDRIITNGCINVTNDVYNKLKTYFVLEVI